MEQTDQIQKEQELTKEQLEQRQLEVTNYHKAQIPFLETQKVYESLIADLEEIELKRVTIRYRMAQMMATPAERSDDNESEQPTEKTRTLKKN